MTLSFDKPLAVVTGASSGIGYELARQFALNGFDLIIAAEDTGIESARSSLATLGAKVESVQVDLSTFPGVEHLVSTIESFQYPVDSIALNAGVGVSGDFASDTRLEDELRLIHLNVESAVHLAKRLLPAMLLRKHGRMLFTSSLAATAPGPYYAVYAASKAFIQSFAEALRYELKDSGVTVTSLMPGPTATNFFARAGMEDTKAGVSEKDSAADVAQEGFEALMANKDSVVAGAFKNKVQSAIGKVLSEPAKAGMQAKFTRPGSAH